MILIYNIHGLGMLFGGAVVGCVVWGVVWLVTGDSRLSAGFGGVWGAGIVAICDLYYRANHYRRLGVLRFFMPTAGGMLYYIPLWILLGVAPLGGLAAAASKKYTSHVQQRPSVVSGGGKPSKAVKGTSR